MSKWTINAAVCNHKGNVRLNNEDNFFLNGQYMPLSKMNDGAELQKQNSHASQVYAVCDGMGGEAAGEQASFMAVHTLKNFLKSKSSASPKEQLGTYVDKASEAIWQKASKEGYRSGTTLTLCWWYEERMYAAHVGDSRIYLLHDDHLKSLTVDHSEVQRMVNLGLITPQEAKVHPKRHVISQYLGMNCTEIKAEPTICAPIELQEGDRFLLCSDGLTDMVDDELIQTILKSGDTPLSTAKALVNQALANGGKDNVTAMCLFAQHTKAKHALKRQRAAMLISGIIFCCAGVMLAIELLHRL